MFLNLYGSVLIFENKFIITRAKVYNLKKFSARISNALIEVAAPEDISKNKQLCAKVPRIAFPDQIQSFGCPPYIIGQYVLTIIPSNYVHVCEMQVFGYKNIFYALDGN